MAYWPRASVGEFWPVDESLVNNIKKKEKTRKCKNTFLKNIILCQQKKKKKVMLSPVCE